MDKDKIASNLWRARYHQNKKWLLSVDLLEDIIADEPRTYKAHKLLCTIYLKRSLFQKAKQILKRAIKYFPNSDYYKFQLGNVYLNNRKKAVDALYWYNQVKNPLPEQKFNMAVAYLYLNKPKKSVALIEDVFPAFKHYVKAYIFLGEQYFKLKKYEKAVDILKGGRDNFPTNKNIAYLLAMVYDKNKEHISAYLTYKTAEELGHSSAKFYNSIANCACQIGNTEEAIKYFNKSINKNVFYTKSYLDLSKLYMDIEEYQKAKKYLKLARKVDPLNIYVTLATQRLKRKYKDLDET